MEGHGVFQVERVGDATESGKVFTAAQIDDGVKTPLDEQMQRLGTLISRFSYLFAALVIVARIVDYLLTDTSWQMDFPCCLTIPMFCCRLLPISCKPS